MILTVIIVMIFRKIRTHTRTHAHTNNHTHTTTHSNVHTDISVSDDWYCSSHVEFRTQNAEQVLVSSILYYSIIIDMYAHIQLLLIK